MSFVAVAVGGGALSSIISGALQSNAASTAAGQQAASQRQAAQLQAQEFNQIQQNQQPFMQGGYQSLAALLGGIQRGTFGSPLQTPAAFQAPTAAQALNDPGYQFTQQQGSKGILTGAAAAGGAINGGTLKSLDQYNQNLAQTTYQNVFNRALQTYGAGLQGYNAQLAGQQQAFNQLLAPIQIGEQATAGVANAGQQYASAAGQNIVGAGNAQAAGTIGANNAWQGTLGGLSNTLAGGLLLSSLNGKNNNVMPGGYIGTASPGVSINSPLYSGAVASSPEGEGAWS